MVVDALRVALPDLDQRPGHGPATRVQHAALEMQHRAHRLRCLTTHLDKVVVHVGREVDRIERPFGLMRRGGEGSGKGALGGEQAGAGAQQ